MEKTKPDTRKLLKGRINTTSSDNQYFMLVDDKEKDPSDDTLNKSVPNPSVTTTPKTTSLRKVSDILMSPVVLFRKKFKTGGMNGSILSLITAILGAGTISLPYLAAQNGIYLATFLIIFGAAISYFCGMLLVSCAEKVGSDKYEDFANYCYGRRMVIFTGWCNCITLLGFVISYVVFVKTL